MHDLVIRNARIVDGTGAPQRAGDIAIDGTRISAVGGRAGNARREIDAEDHLVTPGWVDIHTHYDGQVTWDPYLSPSSWHGVTTLVMGNCGVGFAPAKPSRRDWLIGLMEGVEDIPGTALAEGIDWRWESFPEYLDALDGVPRALDVAAQVPHGAVRAYVMGERGANNEEGTTEDLAAMADIVREAIAAGAVGFSTSRTILHRSIDGVPVPGTYAEAPELLAIGRAMSDAGGGVFEIASDLAPEDREFEWMDPIGSMPGCTISFACVQNDGDPEQWRRLLHHAETAGARGIRIAPQVSVRPPGVLLGLETSFHPFMAHPSYREVESLPLNERAARLRDPNLRVRILSESPATRSPIMRHLWSHWDKVFPLGDPPQYEPAPEAAIASLAARRGHSAAEEAYQQLLEREGRALLYYPIFNYTAGDFGALREMLLHPNTVVGLSDGGAHCGAICDASVPTFLLSHWVRDRDRGERIPLELAVHQQTQRTAELFGFRDRGVLAPGYKADLNVIDLEGLAIQAPEMVYDLPASGRRLVQHVAGYRATVQSGAVTFEDGEATGALPGRLLRGQQPAPA